MNLKRLLIAAILASSVSPALFAASKAIPLDAASAWKPTGPAGGASDIVLLSEEQDGIKPLEVRYEFKKGANDYLFAENETVLPAPPKTIRVKMRGDNKGESLRVNLADATGEFFQAYVGLIDFEGWKAFDAPLEFASHWGGNNDNKMDLPIKFHSIVINSEPGMTENSGSLAFTAFELIGEGGSSSGGGGGGGEEAAPIRMGRSNTVTLDDFERTNPFNVYQTWRGDNSEIDLLSSSEFKKNGNFAMQITYRLITSRSDPSWASASFTPEAPLDWSGVKRLSLWIKGDGTQNNLELNFVDGKSRIWTHHDDEVLRNNDWTLLEVDLADFKTVNGDADQVPDLSKVKKFEFMVTGEQSQITSGKIWIDDFMANGRDLDLAVVSPRPPVAQDVIEKTKVEFGDTLHFEFRNTPENSRQLLFYNTTMLRGSVKNLNLSANIVSQEKEAGESMSFNKASQTSPATEPEEHRPLVELAYINATFQNLHPNLNSLSIGNLYVDYGRDVFSPLFGFKGVQADGNIQSVNYNAFFLKHVYDAYTIGSRLQMMYLGTQFRGMGVYHQNTAWTLENSEISNGQLVVPDSHDALTNLAIKDTVYYADADRTFLSDRVGVTLTYAMNIFERNALEDVSNPQAPRLDPRFYQRVQETGRMGEARFRLKGFPYQISGVSFQEPWLIAGYRDAHVNFKPRFRADPITYDSDNSDVRGPYFELSQVAGRFKAVWYYENVDRGVRGSGYFRQVFRQTYGIYNINRFDIVFTASMRREYYALKTNERSSMTVDPNYPRDKKEVYYELFLGHWFAENFFVWAKFQTSYDTVKIPMVTYRKDYFQMQGEYAVMRNAKLVVSIQQTRYDQKSFEPVSKTQGEITTGSRTLWNNLEDNIVRVYLDINF